MRAAGWLALVVVLASVAPASGSAQTQRRVTIALSGSGKAFWRLDGPGETGRLALRYRWHGTIALDASRPSAPGAATLTAGWSAAYTDKVGGVTSNCTYGGTRVKAAVLATLARGRSPGTIQLRLHPRSGSGFFGPAGKGTAVVCQTGTAPAGLPHFSPFSFFRDNLQDHGRLTSDAAMLALPSTVLPHGRATVAFPFERGRNDSPGLGHIGWNNTGSVTVEAR